MSRRTLHVIAHEGTRTGAPRVLLDLLQRATPYLDVDLSVEVRRAGPLTAALTALATTTSGPADTVLVNSIVALDALDDLSPDLPALVYVHEQGDVFDTLAPQLQRAVARRSTRFLTASRAGRDELVAHGVPAATVEELPPLIDSIEPPEPAAVEAVRTALGSPARLVVGCGEVSWRKGTDLFLEVTRLVSRRGPSAFAWVGHRPAGIGRILDYQAGLLGIDGALTWLGDLDDPMAVLAAADVVVMASRSDPMPLVPLEAAQLGTPTVAFAVGGLAELARFGGAIAAPYPDTLALADAVVGLGADPTAGAALTDRAVEWWRQRQSPSIVVPRFVAAVQALFDGSPTP